MADYIQKQIDMLGQMLQMLAKKLGLNSGYEPHYDIDTIIEVANGCELNINIREIIESADPTAYMVEKLGFSDEALETFTEIIVKSEAEEETKKRVLDGTIGYLESKGKVSFTLYSLKS